MILGFRWRVTGEVQCVQGVGEVLEKVGTPQLDWC